MIHKFKQLGLNIVHDVYSGATHIIDDLSYDILDVIGDEFSEDKLSLVKEALGDKYDEADIEEAFGEINELCKSGDLYSDDCYEYIAKNWNKQSVVKAMCLHIAHDCNLRCQYCFADTGEFHGHRSLMSFEVGKAAIDFVIKNSGARKNIEIDFFGGEPLMNFGVVKQIVDYAEEEGKKFGKNFRFTITTNGILLNDDIISYVNEHMGNIVLSIDGRKEINDSVRKRLDGTGCYDTIVPKFQKVAESRDQDNYYVRGTFTHKNLDFSKDVLHLADLGFKQTSVEPVVLPDGDELAICEEDIEKIYAEYDKLAEEYIKRYKEGKGFNFFHFMVDLEQGPCVIKRLSGCGAGHEYVAVTPEGDIYPCHQFVGNEKFKMGSVFEGGLDEDLKSMFEKSNVYTKSSCKDCFAKFYCSGGCAANAINSNGDINEPYEIGCKLQRKRTECAIAIAAVKSLEKEIG